MPNKQEHIGLLLDRVEELDACESNSQVASSRRLTQLSFTMSSTFCTVVLSSLPVKSNRTPKEVTFLPLRVVNFAKRSGRSVSMHTRLSGESVNAYLRPGR